MGSSVIGSGFGNRFRELLGSPVPPVPAPYRGNRDREPISGTGRSSCSAGTDWWRLWRMATNTTAAGNVGLRHALGDISAVHGAGAE
jgi:hypothetical protein